MGISSYNLFLIAFVKAFTYPSRFLVDPVNYIHTTMNREMEPLPVEVITLTNIYRAFLLDQDVKDMGQIIGFHFKLQFLDGRLLPEEDGQFKFVDVVRGFYLPRDSYGQSPEVNFLIGNS